MEFLRIFIVILIIAGVIKGLQEEFRIDKISYNKKKYFFSYSELKFYHNLQKILRKNFGEKFGIFPKVRLADIFESEKYGDFNKIKAKHIDYLIIDIQNNCNPVVAIELNGNSHFSNKQKKSDSFKKEIFENSEIPLIYFWNSEIERTNLIEEKVINILGKMRYLQN